MDAKKLRNAASWRDRLQLTPHKEPKAVVANALLALREAQEWAGVLAHDEFALVMLAIQPPPWLHGQNTAWTPQRWGDYHDTRTTEWLHHQGIYVSQQVAASAAQAVAMEAAFHPVRDYLNGLKWDAGKRVDKFIATYLGAEESPYHRAVGRCFLVAAVARIMRPGCKADHVPILEAGQGKLKSSAVEALFTPWFTDDLAEFGSKDASMQIQGAWGVEIAELASMQRGEVERVKAFISRRTDRFRPSYGRYVIERPRQCNFVGTTNAEAYLKDETGGRRFWPVKCGKINLDILARDRDQLWAEAVAMYCKGTQWWLSDDSTVAAAAEAQAARYTPDAWQTPIAEHLATVSDCTSVAEILVDVLGIEKSRWDQQA